jgi:hypothetical protein
MTDNTFDKFVRDKLRDHPSAVPTGLWEKIERKKDKGPKGGFFLPRTMLWAGLFVIVAGAGIGYYLSGNNDSNSNISEVRENTASTNNNGNANTPAVPSSANAGGQDENNGTGDNNITNTNNSTGTGNNINSDPKAVIPGAGTDHDADIHRNNSDGNNSDVSVKDRSRQSDNVPGNKNGATIAHKEGNIPVTTVDRQNDRNTGAFISGRKNTRKKTTGIGPLLTVKPADVPATTPEENRISFTAGKTAYNLRSLANFGSNNYNLSELKIIGIDCPPRGDERRNDWYLEVYGSPDIVMKSVKASGNTSFVSKKDSTESQQVSFTGGFRISKSIGEHLLVKTGLQYSQINERFDLRTENERRIITVVTIRTVIGPGGADSTISDTSTVEQIGYRLQRTYNRYRSIDIPLLLSYEFGNDNLKFAINTGAIFNLYSWYEGNTINDSLAVVSMSSKGSGVYKQNIGVGLYAGLSVIKPISKKFDVFLEPYFRYNFSNMSRSAGYSQRFNAMGINLGIRYKLKGRQRSVLN